MRIPILAYDSMQVHGNEYSNNQLKALAADLGHITNAGFRIVPLRTVVDAWLENRPGELTGKLAALTCDHGSDFDFFDLPHPSAGVQRSVLNILRDFARSSRGAQPGLHITSFVVVSPEARSVLDSTCMVGKGWWTDRWWAQAVASGFMHVASNSWDYQHETLPEALSLGTSRGTFATIDRRDLADIEIRDAARFLRQRAPNPGDELFAYPYGAANPYLMYEYFERYSSLLRIKAAFAARPGFLEAGTGRWDVPRFVCGRDWSSPAELQAILDCAADANPAWIPVRRGAAAKDEGCGSTQDVIATAPSPSTAPPRDDTGFEARFAMVPQVVAEWIAPYRKLEGLDILDFGCGEGISALGLALKHKPRRVVGVDIRSESERCLCVARTHLGLGELPRNLEFHRARPGYLHSDEERFDVVYSWSVFEHVDERLMARALQSIRSSLREGGLFLVQVAPFFYSAQGSHLSHKLAEPWAHLLSAHNVLHDRLAGAVPDRSELANLWGTYETLNRITLQELGEHLGANGFEILRTWIDADKRDPPARLKAIFRDEVLATHQAILLARAT